MKKNPYRGFYLETDDKDKCMEVCAAIPRCGLISVREPPNPLCCFYLDYTGCHKASGQTNFKVYHLPSPYPVVAEGKVCDGTHEFPGVNFRTLVPKRYFHGTNKFAQTARTGTTQGRQWSMGVSIEHCWELCKRLDGCTEFGYSYETASCQPYRGTCEFTNDLAESRATGFEGFSAYQGYTPPTPPPTPSTFVTFGYCGENVYGNAYRAEWSDHILFPPLREYDATIADQMKKNPYRGFYLETDDKDKCMEVCAAIPRCGLISVREPPNPLCYFYLDYTGCHKPSGQTNFKVYHLPSPYPVVAEGKVCDGTHEFPGVNFRTLVPKRYFHGTNKFAQTARTGTTQGRQWSMGVSIEHCWELCKR